MNQCRHGNDCLCFKNKKSEFVDPDEQEMLCDFDTYCTKADCYFIHSTTNTKSPAHNSNISNFGAYRQH